MRIEEQLDRFRRTADETLQKQIGEEFPPDWDMQALFEKSYDAFQEESSPQSAHPEPIPPKRTILRTSGMAAVMTAACLLLTIGLVQRVWNRQQKVPAVLPAATETTTAVLTETETTQTTRISTESSSASALPESSGAVTTVTTGVTAARTISGAAETSSVSAAVSAVTTVPATQAQPESTAPSTTAVTASVSSARAYHAPGADASAGIVISTETTAVTECMETDPAETEPPPEETEPASETVTEIPDIDTQEQITAGSGFYLCYCIGDTITMRVRFQETPDDPMDFSTAYSMQSDRMTILEEKECIICGNYCRLFVIRNTETETEYHVMQYLRRDFSFEYPEESGWHFERVTAAEDCWFGFSGSGDGFGDCIWDDGSYVMYVCAERAEAEEIIKALRAAEKKKGYDEEISETSEICSEEESL